MRVFNPPPGWPTPPPGWAPPDGWKPDPSWPEMPSGWVLWLDDDAPPAEATEADSESVASEGVPPSPVSGPAAPAMADEVEQLRAQVAALQAQLASSGQGDQAINLSDQAALQEVGIYRYHHPLESAVAYRERLEALNGQVDELVKSGQAVLAADMFTYDGSLAKGRKMTADFSKLMLRAYNAEADNCVRSLRSGNAKTAVRRLEAAATSIEKLGSMMEMRINPGFHALRVQEIELTADYQMKLQEEKERAREEREQLREQRKVEQELAAQREKLEKERAHYAAAIAALGEESDPDSGSEMRRRLAEIDEAIEANDYRAANIRAGYVYVISNVGAFGPGVVKIGMTRRLEPRERIQELGDASVPFPFDTHALFFSDDAIALEGELHRMFADRKVNLVNDRREFFFVTPSEVREVLAERVGGLLEFTEEPTAEQYYQSKPSWPNSGPTGS